MATFSSSSWSSYTCWTKGNMEWINVSFSRWLWECYFTIWLPYKNNEKNWTVIKIIDL